MYHNNLNKIISFNYAKKFNNNKTKTKLKRIKGKGIGLFATKKIKKNELISIYLLQAYQRGTHKSLKHGRYAVAIPNNIHLVGHLGHDSLSLPKKIGNIYRTFFGYFANEPSCIPLQKKNAILYYPNKSRNKKIKVGDNVIFYLKAIKTIQPGDEILWHYGQRYHRNYCVNNG